MSSSVDSPTVNNTVAAIAANLLVPAHRALNNIPQAAFGAAVVIYVVLCASVRFRRVRRMQRKLNFSNRKSLSKMTNVEAQSILLELAQWEFPTLFRASLQLALFKVSRFMLLLLSTVGCH
jgi:hypothetical protein